MTNFFSEVKEKLKGDKKTIVLPEGNDVRVLQAASRLQNEGLVKPVLLGNEDEVKTCCGRSGTIDVSEIAIIDPAEVSYFEELVEEFVERRKGKATVEQARELLQDVNYFGTMLVYTGRADGLVSGAVHSTADTVRPALQIIRTKPGVSKTSGAFIMMKGDERLVFADCAITVAPTSQELAEIAIESCENSAVIWHESTCCNAVIFNKRFSGDRRNEKVAEAVKIAQ